jgi:sugar-phosphatase
MIDRKPPVHGRPSRDPRAGTALGRRQWAPLAAEHGARPVHELTAAAVLLDMDGTLVDSTAVVESIWREFATAYEIDLGAVLRYSHGRRTFDTVSAFLPDRYAALDVAARIEADELRRLMGIVAIPGAHDFLLALDGARVAVVTSAERELARRRLAAAGLSAPSVLVAAEDVENGKPAPDGFLRAAAALGAPIEECVVFEDAEAGIRAALAAGASTVVVGNHHSPIAVGLPRVADFRAVRARREGERLIFTLR